MAALPTTLEDVLTNIGFNVHARAVLTDPARENLTLAQLNTWNDEDVDSLIYTLRKTYEPTARAAVPAQPAVAAVPAAAGQPAVAAVPARAAVAARDGRLVYVQVSAIENLKTAAYLCRHMVRVQRVPRYEDFTPATLSAWKPERKNEHDYKEPDEAPKLTKSDDATIYEFIDDFPEQLARFTGNGGRPLAYVIRDDETAPAAADDPMFGQIDSVYNSVRDEIIARAALDGPAYKADNKRVFELLRDAISEFEIVKVWIKGYVRSKDGRGAWMAFKAHYLGSAQLDGIANRADVKIETLVYTGEKARYSFEVHVSNFKQAHLDLQKAGNEPDGRAKVRKFLQSIKAPELQTAVGVAQSQDKYLTDFEETINYIRRFVSPVTSSRTISQTSTTNRSSGDTKPPTQPPGLTYRWYKKEEFRDLPEDHKAWLRYEKRRRDKNSSSSGKFEKRKVKNLVRKEKRKLAKLKAQTTKASDKAGSAQSGNESE